MEDRESGEFEAKRERGGKNCSVWFKCEEELEVFSTSITS